MTEALSDFVKYATAFEEAYAADDWRLVDVLFDDEIVWNVAGLPGSTSYAGQGRDQTSRAIQASCNRFDRRFDLRDPQPVKGPVAIPGGIHLEWRVVYTREGLPSFALLGEEWDLFRDGQLVMHYELIHNGAEAVEFIAKHHAELVPIRS